MSVWVAPASSTERKPEPRMSAGLRNLISWLLPSLADHNCISRVREWPLAEVMVIVMVATLVLGAASASMRSEEHTSELQSRPHLVCRLLLEKKKRAHV